MKFKFNPTGQIADVLGKKGCQRFRQTKGDRDNRIWVRDVITLFADLGHLTFGQGVQLIESNNLEAARTIHRRHGESLPMKIQIVEEGHPKMVTNPLRTKLIGYGDMEIVDHTAMMRAHLSWASSIRHPDDPVPKGGRSEADFAKLAVKNKQNLKHPDELRSAHKRRMLIALANATDSSTEKIYHANPR